jgi:serine/threonine protein kinase
MYAIKRIELNPKNKQLNRKITREVKLLSRLNHENVVRYYNSWIESATIEPASALSGTAPSPAPSVITKLDSNQVSLSHSYLHSFRVYRKLYTLYLLALCIPLHTLHARLLDKMLFLCLTN